MAAPGPLLVALIRPARPARTPHYVPLLCLPMCRVPLFPATCNTPIVSQVSLALKWSSVVLMTAGCGGAGAGGGSDGGGSGGGGSGGGDSDHGDGDRGSHSRASFSGSVPAGGPSISSPPPRGGDAGGRASSGECGGGSENAGAGDGVGDGVGVGQPMCLPVHLGRLSCSAEAELDGGTRAAEASV